MITSSVKTWNDSLPGPGRLNNSSERRRCHRRLARREQKKKWDDFHKEKVNFFISQLAKCDNAMTNCDNQMVVGGGGIIQF